ncbi:Protein kinase domain containing protein [Entamoeba marina]
MKQLCGMIRIENAVLGKYREKGSSYSIPELWIICGPISKLSYSDYFGRQNPGFDEIMFMTHDLLNIAEGVSKLNFSCVINEDTIILKRDPASPFPKLMLSPLAFLFGFLPKFRKGGYSHPLFQLALMIQRFGPIRGNEEIIQHLVNGTPVDEILKMRFVQNLKAFVVGPMCSLDLYQPRGVIGKGKYGTVIKCVDYNKNIVAIKESHEESGKGEIDTLRREAVIMRLCDHENIAKFIDFTITQNSLVSCLTGGTDNFLHSFLVMEYCNSGNLDSLVRKYRADDEYLPLTLIGNIFYQMAESLKYLHFKKGMIHRDIKLENYLLTEIDHRLFVKLCDFGFGRAIYDEMETYNGTPLFAAPEIYNNQPYSSKSDLYSLGICLYRLTTTEYPFTAKPELFDKQMLEQKPVTFPDSFNTRDYELIIDLVMKLTKHEKERISWEEFYEHSYMRQIKPNQTKLDRVIIFGQVFFI